MVELHGGVWTENDRTRSKTHHEAFASNGIAVAALDFRQGPAGYPNSVADINYAIRWVKANAALFNSRPDLVGITGTSSGGHLAMLAAMRPNDPRYRRDPAAGRLADGRRQRALRLHVLAGDQSARTASQRQAAERERRTRRRGRRAP